MLYPFDQMPDSSRMWIYQADRPFTDKELQEVEQAAKAFADSWREHGKELKASYSIKHKQFLILAVDESHAEASGCSIDDSVAFVRNIEQHLGVQLLSRSNVALLVGGKVTIRPLDKIKTGIDEGKINKDTLVFNGFINKMADFRNSWTQPAVESWMARYFN